MTRDEAAEWLNEIIQRSADCDKMSIDDERVQAIMVARDVLEAMVPDAETGLVPCGCGGVVEQEDFHDGFFYHSKVECPECGIEIMRAGYTTEEAHDMTKEAWNTAMGWRVEG